MMIENKENNLTEGLLSEEERREIQPDEDQPAAVGSGRFGFTFSCLGIVILVTANVAAFMAVSFTLCYFTHTCRDNDSITYRTRDNDSSTYTREDNDHSYYLKYKTEADRRRESRAYFVAFTFIVVQGAVTLFTLRYLSNPTNAGRRVLSAGYAVFRLRSDPKLKNKELLPLSTMFRNMQQEIGSGLRIFCTSIFPLLCLLPMVMGLAVILILTMFTQQLGFGSKEEREGETYPPHTSPLNVSALSTFVALLLAVTLAFFVYTLSSRVDIFGEAGLHEEPEEQAVDGGRWELEEEQMKFATSRSRSGEEGIVDVV